MNKKIILTSFRTWLPHQTSNASDDLISMLEPESFSNLELTLLRQLPVDRVRAGKNVLAAIDALDPDLVVCCGMAESRQRLSIESNATWEDRQLKTPLPLPCLVKELAHTNISHDAGKFVCEALYYQVLRHLDNYKSHIPSLFVHVPPITTENLAVTRSDFQTIIETVVD